MALPMLARKNIKEFEPKRDENLAKIKQIFNTEFTFECNMENIYENSPESCKNSIGKIMYEKYFGCLAVNLALIMADEDVMKAFLTAVTSRKILFKIEHIDGYKRTKSEIIDGVYSLTINKDEGYFSLHTYEAGYDITELFGKEKISPCNIILKFSKNFSLEVQGNIKKYQLKAALHLDKLKKFLGVEFVFPVDVANIYRELPDSVFKNNIGELVLDKYLSALITNIIDFLQKNPSHRNSFLFKAEQKKIVFNIVGYNSAKPTGVLFQDGAVCINIKATEFGFLPEKTGNNLSSLFV